MNAGNTTNGSTNWLNDPYKTSFHVTWNSTIFPVCIWPTNRPRFRAWVLSSGQRSDLPLKFSLMHRSKISVAEFVFKICSPTHHKILISTLNCTFRLVGICHNRPRSWGQALLHVQRIAAKHRCEQATLDEQSHQTEKNRAKGTEGQSWHQNFSRRQKSGPCCHVYE